MPVYLISGLPATGKSTVGAELARRGCATLDTDKEFGYYGHLMSETPVQLPPVRKLTRSWYAENGWLWDSAKVQQALLAAAEADNGQPVFWYGGARNEKKFYRHFARIFVLSVPGEVLRDRLKARDDPHFNNPNFIHRMLIWNHGVEDQARNIQAILIPSDDSVDNSVDSILQHISEANK